MRLPGQPVNDRTQQSIGIPVGRGYTGWYLRKDGCEATSMEMLYLEAGKIIWFPCCASMLGEQLEMWSGPNAFKPSLDHGENSWIRALEGKRSCTVYRTRGKSLHYSLQLTPSHPWKMDKHLCSFLKFCEICGSNCGCYSCASLCCLVAATF